MPRWTPEAREKQRQAIRRWEPWTQSSGPKSEAGKRASAKNSVKDEVGILIKHSRALARSKVLFLNGASRERVAKTLYYKKGKYCFFQDLREADEGIRQILLSEGS